jgi:hypothetical protein
MNWKVKIRWRRLVGVIASCCRNKHRTKLRSSQIRPGGRMQRVKAGEISTVLGSEAFHSQAPGHVGAEQ